MKICVFSTPFLRRPKCIYPTYSGPFRGGENGGHKENNLYPDRQDKKIKG